MRYLVGYEVYGSVSSTSNLEGMSTFENQEVRHFLTIGIEPEESIDVGRNEDGELVWVTDSPVLRTISAPNIDLFVRDESKETIPEPQSPQITSVLTKFVDILSSKRKIIIWGGGLTAVIVMFLLFTLPTQAEVKNSEPTSLQRQTSGNKLSSPEEAAIDFIRNGYLENFNINTSGELSAHVVSQSGELVLVEVIASENEASKNFATLLLHKQDTGWHIRQVYDVQS